MWRIYLYDQSGVSAKSKKRAVDESTAPMMNHTSYTVQIYCNKHMVHPSINPLTDILLGGFMWKDEYRVSDPFFIVHCKSCGKSIGVPDGAMQCVAFVTAKMCIRRHRSTRSSKKEGNNVHHMCCSIKGWRR